MVLVTQIYFQEKGSGTTASPQKYNFPETQARYVKITITQSHAGSASSLAIYLKSTSLGRQVPQALAKNYPAPHNLILNMENRVQIP